MRFLETRNMLMDELGWNRRVATLAARLAIGADTWESIESTPNFNGNPLLYEHEIRMIRTVGLETVRERMTQ
jgi:hypothetical protein